MTGERSRVAWATSVVLVALVILTTCVSVGMASAKLPIVPWVDRAVTPAILNSQFPKPFPSPRPRTDAPACVPSALVLQSPVFLQWSQNGGYSIQFRNVGLASCLLRGTPRLVATAPGHQTVIAASAGLTETLGQIADTPVGAVVSIDVSVPVACATDSGGSDQGWPVYHSLVVTLPGGSTRRVAGLNLRFPCGMTVSPFFMPKPPVRYPLFWLRYLVPHLWVPKSVNAGGTLVYQVELANPLNWSISLSPCPAYIEHSTLGTKLEYVLNCRSVHMIPAHGFALYQMKMKIPASASRGPVTVFWEFLGPSTVNGRARTTVM